MIAKSFCTRPYKSSDKAECENNHSLIRRIFKKRKSLNNIKTRRFRFNVFTHKQLHKKRFVRPYAIYVSAKKIWKGFFENNQL